MLTYLPREFSDKMISKGVITKHSIENAIKSMSPDQITNFLCEAILGDRHEIHVASMNIEYIKGKYERMELLIRRIQ